MVAMMPIITLQILGLVFKIKNRKTIEERREILMIIYDMNVLILKAWYG